MNLKKVLILFGSIMMGILLVGCAEKSENNSKNKDSGDGPANISIMATLHTPEVPDEKVLKLIEEAANVKLDIEWVPDNNYNEKLNTAFATGTLSKVV